MPFPLRGEKGLKEVWRNLFRDATTRIPDRNLDPILLTFSDHGHVEKAAFP